jgi:hypothetical protein
VVSGEPADTLVRQRFVWYPWWPFAAVVLPLVGIPIALLLRFLSRWELTAVLPVHTDEYRSAWRSQHRRDRVVTASWVVTSVLFLGLILSTNRIAALWAAIPLGILAIAVGIWAGHAPGVISARPTRDRGSVELSGVSDAFAIAVIDGFVTPG